MKKHLYIITCAVVLIGMMVLPGCFCDKNITEPTTTTTPTTPETGTMSGMWYYTYDGGSYSYSYYYKFSVDGSVEYIYISTNTETAYGENYRVKGTYLDACGEVICTMNKYYINNSWITISPVEMRREYFVQSGTTLYSSSGTYEKTSGDDASLVGVYQYDEYSISSTEEGGGYDYISEIANYILTIISTNEFRRDEIYTYYDEEENITESTTNYYLGYYTAIAEGTNLSLSYTITNDNGTSTSSSGSMAFYLTAAGDYSLLISSSGSESGAYQVYTGDWPPSGYSAPTSANDSTDPADDTSSGATAITLSTTEQTKDFNLTAYADLYDWYVCTMVSNTTYTFWSTSTDDIDDYIEIYNSSDLTTPVAENDDGAVGYNFGLTYTPTETGTYYIRIRGFETDETVAATFHYQTGNIAFTTD